MLLKLKSNGKEIEMAKKDFDLFSDDQKRSYTILNKEDNAPKNRSLKMLILTLPRRKNPKATRSLQSGK